MPHVDAIPASTRFFGRIDRFSCECPSCGDIIVILADGGKRHHRSRAQEKLRRQKSKAKDVSYNPLTQRLACPCCKKVYQVGLLLYPVIAKSRTALVPSDADPTPRQVLAIREQHGGGWWAYDPKKSGDPVNLAVKNPCSCPKPYGWNAACPIHGWIPREGELPRDPNESEPGPGEGGESQ